MVNIGLISKAIRETWFSTTAFILAMFTFQVMLAFILPTFQKDLSHVLENLKFVQYIIAALLGTDMAETIGPEALSAMPWVHPAVLTLAWTHAIMFCTRLPAGEIDRGTADVLFALPVSRLGLYLNETIALTGSGLLLVVGGLLGGLLGASWSSAEAPIALSDLVVIAANLFGLYLAVAGLAWMVSAMADRRGRAVGVVFAIVMASFVLNTLATFSESIRRFSAFGLMNYYRPLRVLREHALPVGDLLILLGFAVTCWVIGAIVLARRDIRTV